MNQTVLEVLKFIKENDIKFIRLQFCDIFGELKNISIMSTELEKAFTTGIGFDGSSIRGFVDVQQSDLFLFPDEKTLTILPWRPQTGRVARFFCFIKTAEGEFFKGDSRYFLKNTVEELWKEGYEINIGPECEFYLFKTDDQGEATLVPHDNAGYFDVAPFDKGENIRREICLTLQDMGIRPESSHHESGPGQNEIDFVYDGALEAADNFITFKTVVKTIANLNGLHGSFMAKPIKEKSGSGLHINLSITKNGINLFEENNIYSEEGKFFISGILNKIKEISAILNPTVNSYKRFGDFEAPKYISFGKMNRSQLIRIPAAKGIYSRIELRSPDGSCNPYLAFAIIIKAGMEGIKEKKLLEEPFNENLYKIKSNKNLEKLPENLGEAIGFFERSEFVKRTLGDFLYKKLLNNKKEQWISYKEKFLEEEEITEWEIKNYFFKL